MSSASPAAAATTTVTASCPGKVLILGGYCVLERPNPGLVLAVDARFRCRASWTTKDDTADVLLSSPQWGAGGWRGAYRFSPVAGLVPLPSSTERNPYIERTVAWTLQVLHAQNKYPPPGQGKAALVLDMGGDNDFYSQQANLAELGLPRGKQGLLQLPKQMVVKDKGAKTGLGSSAAMISCIVSAICALVLDKKEEQDKQQFAHRLAQMCHAAVQGKIGSGFDVCAAFFGSMQYVRYDAAPVPAACLSLMTAATTTEPAAADMVASLASCCSNNNVWNEEVAALRLPPGVELLCAEVEDSGSETPSMSKKILDWKAKKGEDYAIWTRLVERNASASGALLQLLQLSQSHPEAYSAAFTALAQLPTSQWTGGGDAAAHQAFVACASAFSQVRQSLRELGTAAGVPVEPEAQQLLCDASLRENGGVMACGVPGAGGNDAIYALVLGKDAAQRVERFWESYSQCKVCPLLLRESRGGAGVELS